MKYKKPHTLVYQAYIVRLIRRMYVCMYMSTAKITIDFEKIKSIAKTRSEEIKSGKVQPIHFETEEAFFNRK